MPTFIVTYDLINPGQKYPELYKVLKSMNGYCHPLESVWFVGSDLSAMDLLKKIQEPLDANDKVFVMETTRKAAWSGSVDKGSTEWLKRDL